MSMLRAAAKRLAESALFARGRRLWAENQRDILLPGRSWSKWDKLLAGGYLIVSDYAAGEFPPRFPDRKVVYENESNVPDHPGLTAVDQLQGAARKPFWGSGGGGNYMCDYLRVLRALERRNIFPPTALLELGSGPGWMAEWLTLNGYEVTATSVRAADCELIEARAASIRARGLPCPLTFHTCPMEEAARLRDVGPFRAVIVYEALHHAFSWIETVAAVRDLLPAGGWFLICNEPNVLHTFVSYRVAKLHHWHEVGIPRGPLIRALREHGFDRIDLLRHRFNTLTHSHWIAARRGA